MNVKTPFPVKLEAGSDYFWCSCGQSKQQPFCDGSHKGTQHSPENLLLKKQRLHTCAAVKKPQTVRSATGPITIWNCKRKR